MAKRVGTAEFEAEVLKEKLPVIVEFYSDSCIPCKQLSPILGGIEDDYEDQVKVVKVNVNFDADLAGEWHPQRYSSSRMARKLTVSADW